MPQRVALRKREIALAIAAGALAAGGAALMLEQMHHDTAPRVYMARQQTYAVTPFGEISALGPENVVVTVGGAPSVRAEGSPEALSRLEAVVRDGKLIIGPKHGHLFGFNWSRLRRATFYVTVPTLDGVSLAGSGVVHVDRVQGRQFDGTIAGSGTLAIADLRVDEANLSVAGSGDAVAAGSARQVRVSVGGSGEVHAGKLQSETAAVSIAGSGDAALAVSRDARISIMGSGDVSIAGPAHCSVSRMGSGHVSCANATED